MEKVNYLNVGCGKKFHPNWVNIDMVSYSPYVQEVNLLKGIPFPDNTFDVVYHSQVLEHIPKENAGQFISECFRVLKPNGILRVVCPDLENIVDEYKRLLLENLNNPTPMSEANYEWVLLEMYDQTVRNQNGGLMAKYLQQPTLINEDYVINRIGYVGKSIREQALNGSKVSIFQKFNNMPKTFTHFKRALQLGINALKDKFHLRSNSTRIGAFRQGGEIHYWMYDRYSLAKLLTECHFKQVVLQSPSSSLIPNWNLYELDIKEGMIYDPTSLFMEAVK